MRWYAQYIDETGKLVSHGWFAVAPAAKPGHAVIDYGGSQPVGVWNETTKDYDGADPSLLVITNRDFIRLFTTPEYVDARNSTDPLIIHLMAVVDKPGPIDLNDPLVAYGINHMRSLDILRSDDRPVAILSGQRAI